MSFLLVCLGIMSLKVSFLLLKTVPLFVRDSLMTSALKEFDYFEREKKK